MLSRITWSSDVERAFRRVPVVALLGPRQCGKTTLAREFVAADSANYFDLENPLDLARLQQPMTALSSLTGLVVIDEIQRCPELFPVLRVLVDRPDVAAQFLILGSASGELLRQSSESLAGRMTTISMRGFSLGEVGLRQQSSHWLRGGFPRSYLSTCDDDSFAWRSDFIHTLLERDFPAWGVRIPAVTLHRFWVMLAHYHGQTFNAAEMAHALGADAKSMRRYLDLLTDAMMVRQLQPWHANIKKRQVKAPKIYLRDSGVLHNLLSIHSERDLLQNPKCGFSWEGYVIEEILHTLRPRAEYFWATQQGAEIDLLVDIDGEMLGIECMRTDTPKITKSMRIACEDLQLSKLIVVYPGDKRFALSSEIEAVPLAELHNLQREDHSVPHGFPR